MRFEKKKPLEKYAYFMQQSDLDVPPMLWIVGSFVAALAVGLLCFLFVPQSLVVDERPILDAIETNFYVIFSHPKDFFLVVFVSSFLIGLLPLVEFVFSFLGVWSNVVGVILMFVFVIPFVEILKTLLYTRRFELVRGHEYARTRVSGFHHL